jgi:NAD(P)-dependent dehydrogenase (short-subunit alcohol dehydrogenase family)
MIGASARFAGIIPLGGLVHDISLDDWRRTIEVNLTGTFLTVAAGARYLIEQGLGDQSWPPGPQPSSGCSRARVPTLLQKGAVHALMQAMALELVPYKIRVNTIVPGQTNTPPSQAIPGYREKVEPNLPLREIAEPEEMGRLVAFAISDAAPHMTGVQLRIDSGRTIA